MSVSLRRPRWRVQCGLHPGAGADTRTVAVRRVSYKPGVKRALIAIAAGLALADAAVVILALPPLLLELDTTVEGVAAVIGVYTAVLAIGAAAVAPRCTAAPPARAGALLFAAASIGCASADSLELLLVDARAPGARRRRRCWPPPSTRSTAAARAAGSGWARPWPAPPPGPALGGALTELFDWRAIFIAQAPIALAAAPALLASPIADRARGAAAPAAGRARRGSRSRCCPGALTAVVFLLVLLLISGWSVEPLAAAAAVTVLPLAAVARLVRCRGAPARARAGRLPAGGRRASPAWRSCRRPRRWWTLLPAAARRLRDRHGVPGAGRRAAARAHARPGGRAAVAAPRRASRWRSSLLAPIVAAELDDQVAAGARARHGAGARRRAAADRQDRAGPAAVRRTSRPRTRATRSPRRSRASAAASRTGDRDLLSRLAAPRPTSSAAAATLLDRLGAARRTSYGEHARARPLAGSTSLLGDRPSAQRLLDDLQRGGPRATRRPQQLGASIDKLGDDLDDVVLAAVDAAFSPAFA